MHHGDTVTSPRLYEAFVANSIPIIFSDDLMVYGLPFIQQLPWRDMAFYVHSSDVTDDMMAKQLTWVRDAPEWILFQKFKAMIKYSALASYGCISRRHFLGVKYLLVGTMESILSNALYKQDVLWNIENSRVTENILRAAYTRCVLNKL